MSHEKIGTTNYFSKYTSCAGSIDIYYYLLFNCNQITVKNVDLKHEVTHLWYNHKQVEIYNIVSYCI